MTLPDDRWEEVEPCVYRLKAYTPKQIEIFNRRPTEFINSVLGGAKGIRRPVEGRLP